MGVFKLDLMTILVLFVVLSVIFTMTSGAGETKSVTPNTALQKPLVQGMENSKNVEFSNINYRNVAPTSSNTRFTGKTWN